MQKNKNREKKFSSIIDMAKGELVETDRPEVEMHPKRCDRCCSEKDESATIAEMVCWTIPETSPPRESLPALKKRLKRHAAEHPQSSLLEKLNRLIFMPVPAYQVALLLLLFLALIAAMILVQRPDVNEFDKGEMIVVDDKTKSETGPIKRLPEETLVTENELKKK